jgi:hypothetical protein
MNFAAVAFFEFMSHLYLTKLRTTMENIRRAGLRSEI